MIEQVLVYEVKSSAKVNYDKLFSADSKYFYWNETTFKNLMVGDYVFVVNTHANQLLFTRLDKKGISIQSDGENTFFFEMGKKFEVSGKWDEFIRLEIITKYSTPNNWKWKSLGSSETTYLNGNRVNLDKSENRIVNINQLKNLSSDEEYTRVLNECLRNFNLIIKDDVKIWFVAQGASFKVNEGMKYLWAPAKSKGDGRSRFYWDNVLKVKKGDIIFNYSDGEIKGVSIATNNGYESNNSQINNDWEQDGYRVDIDLFLLQPPIKIETLIKNKEEINETLSDIVNKPFTTEGKVNQGYLYEFTKEAGKLIFDIYGKKINNKNIDNYFNLVSLNPTINKKASTLKNDNFQIKLLEEELNNAGLIFSSRTVVRFVSSLITKPFVILTGLSGSGKTKLAQAFVQWICQDKSQYRIIPVGADWTNREPLLGYPNALKPEEYVKPDSGVLDLIIQANEQPDLPHFLILDEMNLSHVERYFADFLSVMESKEEIPLYAEGTVGNGVPAKLRVPSNLFIIGTVNIDETTNMFSPKVLDRANTIEFRVSNEEMKGFLSNIKEIQMDAMNSKGAGMAKSFLKLAENKMFKNTEIEAINITLIRFFGELKKTGAEFGFRSATEILRLINQINLMDNKLSTNDKLDIAIVQKLLPKLHGSRRKLCPVLVKLGSFCINGEMRIEKDVFEKVDFDFKGANVLYPLSLEKITRMYRGAVDNGFASFAEA